MCVDTGACDIERCVISSFVIISLDFVPALIRVPLCACALKSLSGGAMAWSDTCDCGIC